GAHFGDVLDPLGAHARGPARDDGLRDAAHRLRGAHRLARVGLAGDDEAAPQRFDEVVGGQVVLLKISISPHAPRSTARITNAGRLGPVVTTGVVGSADERGVRAETGGYDGWDR